MLKRKRQIHLAVEGIWLIFRLKAEATECSLLKAEAMGSSYGFPL
jgi:hypothetical protein